MLLTIGISYLTTVNICEKQNMLYIDFIIDRYNNKRYTVSKGTIQARPEYVPSARFYSNFVKIRSFQA